MDKWEYQNKPFYLENRVVSEFFGWINKGAIEHGTICQERRSVIKNGFEGSNFEAIFALI